MLRTWLSRALPEGAKGAVRDAVRRYRLGLALRRIRALGSGQVPETAVLAALQAAWGNPGFSANLPFLAEVAKQAAAVRGPILECGSGLTTLVLGLLAGRRGVPVHTLEHIPEWVAQMSAELDRYHVPGVTLHQARLVSHGAFQWYELPKTGWPGEFQLVVCDGPPNTTTRGGRYGLLPLVGRQLPAGAIILLDDATYPDEVLLRQRWHAERGMREQLSAAAHQDPRAYAVLTLEPR